MEQDSVQGEGKGFQREVHDRDKDIVGGDKRRGGGTGRKGNDVVLMDRTKMLVHLNGFRVKNAFGSCLDEMPLKSPLWTWKMIAFL